MRALTLGRGLIGALCDAEDALSRLDVRLQNAPAAEGWRRRTDVWEAAAALSNLGQAVDVRDLAMRDAGCELAMGDASVSAAQAVLHRRRRAVRLSAAELADWTVIETLLGRRPRDRTSPSAGIASLSISTAPTREPARGWWEEETAPSPALGFLDGMGLASTSLDEEDAVFGLWCAEPPGLLDWPPLIRAVVALDRWTSLQPLQRAPDVGPLIVTAQLKATKRLAAAPLIVEEGRRRLARRGRRWSSQDHSESRAIFWLQVLAEGARFGLSELDSLSIARQRFDLHLKGRRSTSRLPDLCDLFLASPIVTAASAAKSVGISQQAARTLIQELDGVVHEATGQQSYRAWRL